MKASNTATAVAGKETRKNNNTSLIVVSPKDENKNLFPSPSVETPQEQKETKKVLSIEELKNKSMALDALTSKHNAVIEKSQELDKFNVLHEESQAKIVITDVNGLSFESANPKTIEQVIKLWKENFEEAKTIIEGKIRQVYAD